jgi:hypothetical protein
MPRDSREESKLVVETYKSIRMALLKVLPSVDHKSATSAAVDLADLWAVAGNHRRNVRELLRLQRDDQDALETLLANIEVDWLVEARNHITSLERELKRLNLALRKAQPGGTRKRP